MTCKSLLFISLLLMTVNTTAIVVVKWSIVMTKIIILNDFNIIVVLFVYEMQLLSQIFFYFKHFSHTWNLNFYRLVWFFVVQMPLTLAWRHQHHSAASLHQDHVLAQCQANVGQHFVLKCSSYHIFLFRSRSNSQIAQAKLI